MCIRDSANPVTLEGTPVLLPTVAGDASYLALVCRKRTTLYPGYTTLLWHARYLLQSTDKLCRRYVLGTCLVPTSSMPYWCWMSVASPAANTALSHPFTTIVRYSSLPSYA
eukprot:1546753-Rhodomonas_salina.1